jgi:hypothetical protein
MRTVRTVAPAPFHGQPTGLAKGLASVPRPPDPGRWPLGAAPGKLTPVAVATPLRLRVRHPLPPARWPTRDEALRARWFSPVRIGPSCVAAERTWVPAMVPWRATEDGHVTPEVVEWYARFAAGQPGVLVVEATGIRDVPSGPLLRIGSDRFIPGLRCLTSDTSR